MGRARGRTGLGAKMVSFGRRKGKGGRPTKVGVVLLRKLLDVVFVPAAARALAEAFVALRFLEVEVEPSLVTDVTEADDRLVEDGVELVHEVPIGVGDGAEAELALFVRQADEIFFGKLVGVPRCRRRWWWRGVAFFV